MVVREEFVNKIKQMTTGETLVEEETFKYMGKHFIPGLQGTKKIPFSVCSAGIGEYEDENGGVYIDVADGKCVGCVQHNVYENSDKDLPDEERPVAVGRPSISRVYRVVLLAYYHRVPTGKKSKRGYDLYDRFLCKGRSCKLCNREDVETYFGQTAFIELGRNHSTTFDRIAEDQIGRNCRCGGEITPKAFACPECGDSIEVSWELLDSDEKDKLLNEEIRCKACGVESLFNELISCSNPECEKPRPRTIFNTVMWLERSGEGYDTTLTLTKWAPPEAVLDKEKIGIIKELNAETFDLSKTHPMMSLDMQARKIGIVNPYAGEQDNNGEYQERGKAKGKAESSKPTAEMEEKAESVWDDDDLNFD